MIVVLIFVCFFAQTFFVSRLGKGEVSDYKLSRDKALRKLAAAILFSATVVGGKSTAMDSKGNKVLVCDNGTGVSQVDCYILVSAFCQLICLLGCCFSSSSADLQARTSQLISFLRWWEDRLLDQQQK